MKVLEKMLGSLNDYVDLLCAYAILKSDMILTVDDMIEKFSDDDILDSFSEIQLKDYVINNYYIEDWVCWND